MKNTKLIWSWVGIFIIALVVSLPFESAQALAASVSITKNEGQKGIEKFIDANGDTWTVEATITDTQTEIVDPKNIKIKEKNINTKTKAVLFLIISSFYFFFSIFLQPIPPSSFYAHRPIS